MEQQYMQALATFKAEEQALKVRIQLQQSACGAPRAAAVRHFCFTYDVVHISMILKASLKRQSGRGNLEEAFWMSSAVVWRDCRRRRIASRARRRS